MKRLLSISSFLLIITGLLLASGGVWGIAFTYTNVTRENITTPEDAAIPNVPVRGPFTLKSQADTIRMHTLNMTDGKTFAEMPRQISKLDVEGNPIIDKDGKPVMMTNTTRDIWITATTLITALNLGTFAYAFSAVVLLFGLLSTLIGIIFYTLSRKY